MSNSAAVYARIDPQLKQDVEVILNQLNVSPSALIQMLYGQIKLTKGIPFEIKLPERRPVFIEDLSPEELDKEIAKGLEDLEEGRVISKEDAEEIFKKEFGFW